MIREDRELMVELERVTSQVVQFTLGILGADPVSVEAQLDLGEQLIKAGIHLRERAEAGEVVNGYLNGTVLPGTIIEAPHDEPRSDRPDLCADRPKWLYHNGSRHLDRRQRDR